MKNASTIQQDSNDKPVKWYREFYVWLLIFFPVMSIFMGITTIVLAISSYDGLVVDDYYKRGMAINEVLAREEKAGQLGLSSSLNIDESDGRIAVHLSADDRFSYPERINVQFMHATRAGYDQSLKLVRTSDGLYQGAIPSLPAGRWHVEISAGDWRLLDSHWQEL
ncbi:MAG: FixH family protein [Gammaproteobacteria bacterium]|nr:FixH family protein [Gammaproteobacteria bacterium]